MPTSANTPDQRSDRYARYIQVGPTPATHLSRWVHPNGTTKSHPPPSIVKALTPSQLADTPSSPLPHNHAHLGRARLRPDRVDSRSCFGNERNGADVGHGESCHPVRPIRDNDHQHSRGDHNGRNEFDGGPELRRLYNSDGTTLLGQTTDQSTAFASTGTKTMPLATPYVMTAPGLVRVMFWSVFSGTAPQYARAGAINVSTTNFGRSSAPYRASAADALTTTAPASMGAETATSLVVPLVALS